MATERLRYLIEAIWSGRGATISASRDIEGVGTSGKKATMSLKDLAATGTIVAAGLAGAAVTAKKAWDLLGEGAGLARARDQFERLSASIGENADQMLADMTAATSGMVSQAELVAGAGQIMSLGLADTGEGVVRLSNLVSQLGWDMSQVILTFANNSKMRLDALGLSVTDVEERMKKLQDAGMNADQAFDLAVIEAGEAKLALLGDAAETTAGQMQIVETAIADVITQVKELAAVQAAPFLAAFTGADTAQQRRELQAMIDVANDADDAFGALQQTANLFNRTINNPIGNVDVIAPLIEDAVDAMARYNAEGMVTVEISRNLSGAARDYAMAYWLENADAIMRAADAYNAAQAAADSYFNLVQQHANVTGPLAPLQEDPFEAGAGAIPNYEHFLKFLETGATSAAAKLAEVRGEYIALIEAGRTERGDLFAGLFDSSELDQFQQAMLNVAASSGTAGDQLLALAGNTDAAREAMENAAFTQFAEQLGQQVAEGTITAQQALQDLQDFMDGFDLDAFLQSQNVVGSGESSTEAIKDTMLGYVEGIDAVAAEAAGAAATETKKVIELAGDLEGPWPYEVDYSSVTAAVQETQGLVDLIQQLEGVTLPAVPGSGGGGGAAVYAQSGANFTVPSGFNENFPIYASSGEHVVITPPGQQGAMGGMQPAGGGQPIIVQIYTQPGMSPQAIINQMQHQISQFGYSLRG